MCYSNTPGAIVNIEGQNKYDKNHIYLLWGKHHVRLSLKYENVNYNVKLKRSGWNVDENISLLPSLVGSGGGGRPPGRRLPVREWRDSVVRRQSARQVGHVQSQPVITEQQQQYQHEPQLQLQPQQAADFPPAGQWSPDLPD